MKHPKSSGFWNGFCPSNKTTFQSNPTFTPLSSSHPGPCGTHPVAETSSRKRPRGVKLPWLLPSDPANLQSLHLLVQVSDGITNLKKKQNKIHHESTKYSADFLIAQSQTIYRNIMKIWSLINFKNEFLQPFIFLKKVCWDPSVKALTDIFLAKRVADRDLLRSNFYSFKRPQRSGKTALMNLNRPMWWIMYIFVAQVPGWTSFFSHSRLPPLRRETKTKTVGIFGPPKPPSSWPMCQCNAWPETKAPPEKKRQISPDIWNWILTPLDS